MSVVLRLAAALLVIALGVTPSAALSCLTPCDIAGGSLCPPVLRHAAVQSHDRSLCCMTGAPGAAPSPPDMAMAAESDMPSPDSSALLPGGVSTADPSARDFAPVQAWPLKAPLTARLFLLNASFLI